MIEATPSLLPKRPKMRDRSKKKQLNEQKKICIELGTSSWNSFLLLFALMHTLDVQHEYFTWAICCSIHRIFHKNGPTTYQANPSQRNEKKILICEFHFTSCFSLLHTHTHTEETFPRKIQLFFGMLFSANKTNMLLVWPLARPWIPKNSPLNNSWLFSFIVKLLTVFFSLSFYCRWLCCLFVTRIGRFF